METRMRAGITHGDVNGISYELIIKMMAENRICEVCTPILYGSPKVAAYHRKMLNVENFNLNNVQSAKDANPKRCNVINCADDAVKVDLNQETQESDRTAMEALKRALDDADHKEIDVVVAAPQCGKSFRLENAISYCDLLAKRYNTENGMALLVGSKMKVAFVTTHIPFCDIAKHMTQENIFGKLKQLDATLRKDFGIRKPRIAVLGLNPHEENDGTNGDGLSTVVAAVDMAREKGIMALGPFAAENLFKGVEYSKFDAILAMYHGQGMMPFKMIEGDEGAVLYAGLPIVFTTTVSGTAYDITGQNMADETALNKALYTALDVYAHRQQIVRPNTDPAQQSREATAESDESDSETEQTDDVEDNGTEN